MIFSIWNDETKGIERGIHGIERLKKMLLPLNQSKATKKLKDTMSNNLNNDMPLFEQYLELRRKNIDIETAWNATLTKGSKEIKKNEASIKAGILTMEKYSESQLKAINSAEAPSIKDHVKSLGTEAFSILGNMATGAVIGFAATTLINLITDAIHKTEELINAGKQAKETISQLANDYKRTFSSVNNIAGDYAELSQYIGPENTNTGGLSSKQYEEFLNINNESQTSGTADNGQILSGYTSWTNGIQRTGSMPNRGAVSQALNAGGSYTIPAGYHNGSGKITANSLAAQTSANASAGRIHSGYTAWVNGTRLTGTAPIRYYASGTATWSGGTLTVRCGFNPVSCVARAHLGGRWYVVSLDPHDRSVCWWVKQDDHGALLPAGLVNDGSGIGVNFGGFGDGIATSGNYSYIAIA